MLQIDDLLFLSQQCGDDNPSLSRKLIFPSFFFIIESIFLIFLTSFFQRLFILFSLFTIMAISLFIAFFLFKLAYYSWRKSSHNTHAICNIYGSMVTVRLLLLPGLFSSCIGLILLVIPRSSHFVGSIFLNNNKRKMSAVKESLIFYANETI